MRKSAGAITPAVVLIVLGLAALCTAQEATTGTIEGQVTDAQGLGIPGATVTVTGPQGSKSIVTDSEGRFFVPFLTPGIHDIKVELSGFRPTTVEDVAVSLGQRATLAPITLNLGALTEKVEVVGSPPTVDTSSASTGASLEADLLQRLPTQRQVSDVVQLAAGVGCGSQRDSRRPAPRTPTYRQSRDIS